ncbi:5-formyltetrahydrofolate cyclo-ligase [Vibrio sp. JC009]|uniref:5-formyltetrahydrofolate cyclo-ligase n=1 Tax=Vibrio sp. JC009 TaxID=2912314 RepID=UPI0023B1E367|nr:5-formyltetrahydrofolate cyclo-ligase [Vibrio sp. JC009]WED22228.1 5-formyltetrahydrofolate cyclo-ligase [Vibrio sp. JC009]
MPNLSRTEIRKQIRSNRNAINALDQTLAAEDILQKVKKFPLIQTAQNIAIYLSADGEIDTHPIIEYFWQQGKTVCLPVIHPFSKGHLLFLEYTPQTPMVENRFNIQEPELDKQKIVPVSELDIVFTPLVAFDDKGHRLGMGGGYYDRTLEKWFKTGEGPTPAGIAHNCQQVDEVPVEPWDVPLPYIITPDKIWQWESE